MSRLLLNISSLAGNDTISYSKNYRVLTANESIEDVIGITSLTDVVDIGGGDVSYLKRYFRYSYDGESWSLWYEFDPTDPTDSGTDVIKTIEFDVDRLVYFSFKYEYDDGFYDGIDPPVTITRVSVSMTQTDVSAPLDLRTVNATAACSDEYCPSIIFNRSATFDPYSGVQMQKMQRDISQMVNIMFGLQVLYFRTTPDSESGDYIFREWLLFNVTDLKCVKLCVPNNDFPDNKLLFNQFGIDFDIPFEVHVDNQYFKSIFGKDTEPRQKDFLYFPLLNRMFEVQGSYLYRGLMMEPVFWKMQLIKFTPNINLVMSQENTQFLDNLLLSSDEAFGKEVADDVADSVMPKQHDTISDRSDETRASLNANLEINRVDIFFNYTQLVDYYYDMSTVEGLDAVVYHAVGVLNADAPSFTYTCMFNIRSGAVNLSFIKAYDESSPSTSVGINMFGLYNATSKVLNVSLTLNEKTYDAHFTTIETDQWYALVVQFSVEFKQAGFFVYSMEQDTTDDRNYNDMTLVSKSTLPIDAVSITTDYKYKTIGSKLYLTNIRLYNRFIDYEDHQFLLGQLFIRKESMLYMIDNCRPQLGAPYIMKKF